MMHMKARKVLGREAKGTSDVVWVRVEWVNVAQDI
jgi:hypothetical protein